VYWIAHGGGGCIPGTTLAGPFSGTPPALGCAGDRGRYCHWPVRAWGGQGRSATVSPLLVRPGLPPLWPGGRLLAFVGSGFLLSIGVLATCGIRRPELAYEDTHSCLLFLANFPEKVYNLRHSPARLHKGDGYCARNAHLHHAVGTLVSSVVPSP